MQRITKNNAKTTNAINAKRATKSNDVPKAFNRSNETPTILLKTLHDDIMRDNKNATITTKKMRVKLRATPLTQRIHERNASWIFTKSQYDIVRSMFDASYAQRIARRAKTNAKKNDAPKNDAPSNVEKIDA